MNFQDKIHTADSLPAWREALRAQGIPLAATNGCFDILHAGHVNYLQAARNEAGALIVGLNSDRSVSELKGLRVIYMRNNSFEGAMPWLISVLFANRPSLSRTRLQSISRILQ